MTTVTDLLRKEVEDDNELSYTDKQMGIIKAAASHAEMSAAELHRLLQDEWDDPPSQGYIYNVLQRATPGGYKAASTDLDESEEMPAEQEEKSGETKPKAEEKERVSAQSATVSSGGGTITISISLPEDSDVDVELEEEKEPLVAE